MKSAASIAAIRFIEYLSSRLPSTIERFPGVFIARGVSGLHNVTFLAGASVGRGVSFQGSDISVGAGTTIGLGCVINGPVTLGNHCQLGSYVGIYGVSHPTDVIVPNVNTHFLGVEMKRKIKRELVSVGHGVWLGQGVTIMPGIAIGNGAIVGAGSVVTSDIPPYSIAVGTPARIHRHRLPDALVKEIEELQWWLWDADERMNKKQLFLTSIDDDANTFRVVLDSQSGNM